MNTKLTRSFNINIKKFSNSYSYRLVIKKSPEKILYFIDTERYDNRNACIKIYLFNNNYILYIKEFPKYTPPRSSIIKKDCLFIISEYPGFKDIKTFEFKYSILIL